MSVHDIPEDALNSRINYCIDEFVRLERDREILRDHWFRGYSLKELSKKYDLSDTSVKRIIWGVGDKILLKSIQQ